MAVILHQRRHPGHSSRSTRCELFAIGIGGGIIGTTTGGVSTGSRSALCSRTGEAIMIAPRRVVIFHASPQAAVSDTAQAEPRHAEGLPPRD